MDLSDEEAVHYMQSLIDESVGALFAAVVEQIHKFAQVSDVKGLVVKPPPNHLNCRNTTPWGESRVPHVVHAEVDR